MSEKDINYLKEFIEEALIKRLDRIESKLDEVTDQTNINTTNIAKHDIKLKIYTGLLTVINGVATSLLALFK